MKTSCFRRLPGFFLLVCIFIFSVPSRYITGGIAYADKPCVIVIDPGHGGMSAGTCQNGLQEKDLNLTVAIAMYEELLQYDNVEVYLTRTNDTDMGLIERADFAAEKDADFLFCLHFNMSPNHNLFGTEIWISAFGKYYSEGMSFGKIQMETMQGLGLYNRGIKTKLLESKEEDYYGIIRQSRAVGIPCALIEHCYLDHKNDEGYYETEDKLKLLGRADAEAAAKYLGLSSQKLGVDYKDYPREKIPVPKKVMKPDDTSPEICTLEEISCDTSNGEVSFSLTATDPESSMLYYSYSMDGGVTWSELFPWQENVDTLNITLTIPSGSPNPQVMFRAYNLYDLPTESNSITYPTFSYGEEPDVEQAEANQALTTSDLESDESSPQDSADETGEDNLTEMPTETSVNASFYIFLGVSLLLACIIFSSVMMANWLVKAVRRARKRRQLKKRIRALSAKRNRNRRW